MSGKDRDVIKRMISYCGDVGLLMEKYHKDYKTYREDISFQYSCNMCIIQIGELVGRLSESFMEEHSEIPWHAIRAMRNLHAHDYERVDLEIVWTTLVEDIPNLKGFLEEIL